MPRRSLPVRNLLSALHASETNGRRHSLSLASLPDTVVERSGGGLLCAHGGLQVIS